MSEMTPLYCEGCGEPVEIPEPRTSNPTYMRESKPPAAGRVTWHYGGTVIHQCKDGTYLTPGNTASPKG